MDRALPLITRPLAYNGDIVTENDLLAMIDRYKSAPAGLTEVMVGRSLMADPALFRKAKGGKPASAKEIIDFYSELFDCYAEHFQSRKNALMRMKEYWFFQLNLFDENSKNEQNKSLQKYGKEILRNKEPAQFERLIEEIAQSFALLSQAKYGWHKPL